MWKRLARSDAFIAVVGWLLAGYLRLVWRTSRFTIDPPEGYDIIAQGWPAIVAMWHGQHFMVPFVRKPEQKVAVLISRHRDGEANARAVRRLGLMLIRGSGDSKRRFLRKGGAVALREMARALDAGTTVALTADVPKGPARISGLGIVTLARISGRPIYPVATATSRRIELNSWDKAAVNLPFSRGVFVLGDPVLVPEDADSEMMEAKRLEVENGLNAATKRAYAIVDRHDRG
ncbi:MAG TPA: lysophospholipid acyltransferase family protein [Hyphomicrobiales bacterium]|nr:lysophospholipid acyltransferase family protein [Rhodobiaceae bacterium]HXK54464.1 lysophospholipid acyltransferase family protein [Hyphomicrobiales bacterium]